MALKVGDLVILNAVWGRQGMRTGEYEGDACIILKPHGGLPDVWEVLHGSSGQTSVFYQDYFNKVEGT